MSFWSSLASITKSSQDGWLSRVLVGAGISLASYSLHTLVLEQYLQDYIASLNGTSAFGASLIHMSGLDVYMQIVLTALIVAMAQNSSSLFLKSRI